MLPGWMDHSSSFLLCNITRNGPFRATEKLHAVRLGLLLG